MEGTIKTILIVTETTTENGVIIGWLRFSFYDLVITA